MRNDHIAESFLEDSRERLEEAQNAYHNGNYHRVVRLSQETVELALKGLLRLVGVDYPQMHDVGDVLRDTLRDRAHVNEEELEAVAAISSRLAADREPSFYGNDEGTPASELFGEPEGRRALDDARRVIRFVDGLAPPNRHE